MYDENNQLQSLEVCGCSPFGPPPYNVSAWSLLVIPPYLYVSLGPYRANDPEVTAFLLDAIVGSTQFVVRQTDLAELLSVGAVGAVTNLKAYNPFTSTIPDDQCNTTTTTYQLVAFGAIAFGICALVLCVIIYWRQHRAPEERQRLIQHH